MSALESKVITYVRYLGSVENDGQLSARDAPVVTVLESVGFVVRETHESLTLARDIREGGDICCCLAIPKPSILERVGLRASPSSLDSAFDAVPGPGPEVSVPKGGYPPVGPNFSIYRGIP